MVWRGSAASIDAAAGIGTAEECTSLLIGLMDYHEPDG
jgi:hypothetical protein